MGFMPRLTTKMWINAYNTKQLKTFDLGIVMQGNGFDHDKDKSSRKSLERQSADRKITNVIKIRN